MLRPTDPEEGAGARHADKAAGSARRRRAGSGPLAAPLLQPAAADALVQLLDRLQMTDYDFVTPSNRTCRIIHRRRARARDLRDVLGWSLPFEPHVLTAGLISLLEQAGAVREAHGELRAQVRVSKVRGHLFVHSAFGARDPDTVFLGPDTYRFVRFIDEALRDAGAIGSIAEIGAGSGAGIVCAAALTGADRLWAGDVNPRALGLLAVNARHAGLEVTLKQTDGLKGLSGQVDLILANPPFIASSGSLYSDGGSGLGSETALAWASQAVGRLCPGGRLVLYSGAPITPEGDPLRAGLTRLARREGLELRYDEIDPDIFSGELERPEYATVERISAVGAVLVRPG